ncbi:MAG: glycoside hydrolase family 2, partial [Humibacter sp.]
MALNDNTGAEAMPSALPVASRQDGEYPRPQMMRANWTDLDGTWSFRHGEAGDHALHRAGFSGGSEILVPFPPESVASGIAAPGFHPVVWYARTITEADLRLAGLSESSSRIMLHFGAVDYRATVWIDGELIGVHEGGHTPFSF